MEIKTPHGDDASQLPTIEQVAQHEVYKNQYVTVYDDEVLFGGVVPGRYLRILERDNKPGAGVLARCGDRYALVLTYRYPTSAYEWGIPRGFAHGDDPAATARNELSEEIGGRPTSLVPLGLVNPNSGLLAAQVHLFLGEFDAEVATPEDEQEILKVRWVSLDELLTAVAEGEIDDAFTLSAIALASAKGLLDAHRR
ncbi:NUDIX hydrolase [Kineosporia succinea]|uniref:ADP-ribose pyrophosphatase n=1 Tax=Kineosporia succinea TaxID=84632 RepID=A0ABT9NX59_9ACTN|nr:NUDIX hydrolase [Kineosporia succinea]MDP9825013.1 ADP-ribose pyrophosphatase [Kineosporia succinea]